MTDFDMDARDFPEVFQTFDEAAIRNQRAHFRSMKCELVLLLAISIIGSLTWGPFVGLESAVLFVIAVLLVLMIVLAGFRFNRRFDHTWFACRAVAESVKAESWRYMMKADPYLGPSSADTKARFLSRLSEILDDPPADAKMRVSELTATSPQITESMHRVRESPFSERLRIYKQDRLGDQRTWYTQKARENEKNEQFWFFGGFALQTGAAVAALVLVFLRILTLNVVGILATASAAARSWSNARSHRELSHSYALTARELAILDSRVDQVITEADLAKLVLEVEQAISREHTKWIFRRFP